MSVEKLCSAEHIVYISRNFYLLSSISRLSSDVPNVCKGEMCHVIILISSDGETTPSPGQSLLSPPMINDHYQLHLLETQTLEANGNRARGDLAKKEWISLNTILKEELKVC